MSERMTRGVCDQITNMGIHAMRVQQYISRVRACTVMLLPDVSAPFMAARCARLHPATSMPTALAPRSSSTRHAPPPCSARQLPKMTILKSD